MTKYLDENGLLYMWGKIKGYTTNSISGKADKVASATNGNFASLDSNGNLVDSGHKHSDYITDINGKVDKTTEINGHALSGNVTVTKSDVGLSDVTNDAQVKRTEMGVANGVATLDSSGKIPSSQLPSYVDDVVEVYGRTGETALSNTWLSATSNGSALIPETGKIYVLMADFTSGTTTYYANSQYRWGGSTYTQIYDSGVTAITNGEIDTIVAS